MRVRNGDCDIGFRRSRCDRAIFINAKIEVSQSSTNLVCVTAAAEDWPSEIIFKDIASPVAQEHATRENTLAVADAARDSSRVIAGENRIEPFDPLLCDRGIGEGERCIPGLETLNTLATPRRSRCKLGL